MADVATDWRSNPEWRGNYVFWTARGVSKTGCMDPHDEVGRVLTRAEAVWFYGQIRDQSRRDEGEWRAEFLWLFLQLDPLELPPLPPGDLLEKYPRQEPLPHMGDPPSEIEIPF